MATLLHSVVARVLMKKTFTLMVPTNNQLRGSRIIVRGTTEILDRNYFFENHEIQNRPSPAHNISLQVRINPEDLKSILIINNVSVSIDEFLKTNLPIIYFKDQGRKNAFVLLPFATLKPTSLVVRP